MPKHFSDLKAGTGAGVGAALARSGRATVAATAEATSTEVFISISFGKGIRLAGRRLSAARASIKCRYLMIAMRGAYRPAALTWRRGPKPGSNPEAARRRGAW